MATVVNETIDKNICPITHKKVTELDEEYYDKFRTTETKSNL